MLRFEMEATVRDKTGKGVARKLRAEGMIPAILYGPGSTPVPLAVNAFDLQKLLTRAKGERILFTLNLKNNGASEQRLALIKEFQFHPVNDSIQHIDFYEVSMDRELHVEVPVKLVGKAKGVEVEKGVLEIKRRTLEVACLPTNIPDEIEVDVTDLGLGEAIHIGDIEPPEGVRIIDPPRLTIVTIVGSGAMEAATEEEAEEGLEEEVVETEEA
ncbi:MAG TPA: 50S ribosomal protein L25 [Dissulfuribacter thermophilus]|uniref:Large ribosomal subunit protein bL25 n=1 Tax=Dissulfuribacter thermophilus TaxID=1156395 RepID=A0A7V2WSW4_9BACT|nr:50S ribosomal protein L25 [Dissulfuribacter thermophilus]